MGFAIIIASLLAATAIAAPAANSTKRNTGEWVSIPYLENWNEGSIYDGTGNGVDQYVMYTGSGQTADGWPAWNQWVSFDNMFNNNKGIMGSSCAQWGVPNNSDEETGEIWNAVQQVAQTTGVDHRFVLAVILQESGGCVRVPTTAWSHANPGLMQSFAGANSCNNGGAVTNPCPQSTITGMVSDGTAGTDSGSGLADCINSAASWNTNGGSVADFYRAARIYNTGSITDGNHLETVAAGTPCYSSDIANRLMGWVSAPHACYY